MSENQTKPAPASDPVQSGRDAIARERARLVASNAHWWDATDDEKAFARLLNPVPPVDAAWNTDERPLLATAHEVRQSMAPCSNRGLLHYRIAADWIELKKRNAAMQAEIARLRVVAELDAAPFLAVEDEEAGGQE